jgi:hypothetical protein
MTTYGVERWTRSGRLTVGVAAGALLVLALLPTLASGLVIDKLTIAGNDVPAGPVEEADNILENL